MPDTDSPYSFDFITDDSARVIYNNLPQIFSDFRHEEGEAPYDSAYLVEYWEQHYLRWLQALSVIVNYAGDMNVFSDSQINSLAPFFGFAGEWFDESWSKQTKIKLYQGVYSEPYIWRFRGSKVVYDYVALALGIKAYITTNQGFIAGISKAGDVCGDGSNDGEIIIMYPSSYFDNSIEKGYLDYLNEHFIPLHIHYDLLPKDSLNEG